jgi:hypothetical protein
MGVQKIESAEQFQQLLKSNEKLVAEFSATWYDSLTKVWTMSNDFSQSSSIGRPIHSNQVC